jgi:hypothetical protein
MKKIIAIVVSTFALSAPLSAGVSVGGAALIGLGSFFAGFHTGNSHARHEVREVHEVRYIEEGCDCCDECECDDCLDSCAHECHVVVEQVVPVRRVHVHHPRVRYVSRPRHHVVSTHVYHHREPAKVVVKEKGRGHVQGHGESGRVVREKEGERVQVGANHGAGTRIAVAQSR